MTDPLATTTVTTTGPLSAEGQRTLAALQTAATEVLDRKHRLGHYAVIWQDGKPTLSGGDRLSERQWLLADKTALERLLVHTPEKARLTRMSTLARLKHIDAMLAQLPAEPQT